MNMEKMEQDPGAPKTLNLKDIRINDPVYVEISSANENGEIVYEIVSGVVERADPAFVSVKVYGEGGAVYNMNLIPDEYGNVRGISPYPY